jgi:hypothetical protein
MHDSVQERSAAAPLSFYLLLLLWGCNIRNVFNQRVDENPDRSFARNIGRYGCASQDLQQA